MMEGSYVKVHKTVVFHIYDSDKNEPFFKVLKEIRKPISSYYVPFMEMLADTVR